MLFDNSGKSIFRLSRIDSSSTRSLCHHSSQLEYSHSHQSLITGIVLVSGEVIFQKALPKASDDFRFSCQLHPRYPSGIGPNMNPSANLLRLQISGFFDFFRFLDLIKIFSTVKERDLNNFIFGPVHEGTRGEVVKKNERRRWLSGETFPRSAFHSDSKSGSLCF